MTVDAAYEFLGIAPPDRGEKPETPPRRFRDASETRHCLPRSRSPWEPAWSLPPSGSLEKLKMRFRKMSLKWHPDKNIRRPEVED